MARKSSIDVLPEAIRVEIGRLNQLGWTIDQILEHLRGLLDQAPSRSALGRHLQKVERITERLRRTRQIAEAVNGRLENASESEIARTNIEILHGLIFDAVSMVADADEQGGEEAAALAPKQIMEISKAVHNLITASRHNVEFVAAIEKRAADKARREALTAAADKAETIARERGLSAEQTAAMRREILGLRPPSPPAAAA